MTDKKMRSDPQGMIDENLKRVFQEKLDEAVPDRFAELLEKLKKQETKPPADEK